MIIYFKKKTKVMPWLVHVNYKNTIVIQKRNTHTIRKLTYLSPLGIVKLNYSISEHYVQCIYNYKALPTSSEYSECFCDMLRYIRQDFI